MRGPRVTLEQWRTLQAVVDSGGFAQAAEALHKSQSSISYSVGKLQEQLGMELLSIEGRRAVLTPAGEALLQRARHLLDHALTLEQVASGLQQGWEAEIGIAVDAAFPLPVMITAFKQFLPESQGTRLLFREEVLSGASEALIERKVDLAITPWVPPGFMGEKLIDIHFIAVASPEHPLNNLGRKVTATDMCQEMQLVIRDSAIKQNRDSGWLGSEQRWTVTSLESAKSFIVNGLGFGWLTHHEAFNLIQQGKIKALDLDVEYNKHGTLYLVYAQKETSGPATNLLAREVKKAAANYALSQPSLSELCAGQGKCSDTES